MTLFKKCLTTIFVILLAASSLVLAAPERIVSLVPSITENLFALGAGSRVVGVTSWCDYPAEATTKTVVGDAFSLNLEVLLSLEPDLIIGDGTLVQTHLQQFKDLNIPVLTISPTTIKEIGDELITLGQAVGEEERGRELAAAMTLRQDQLVAKIRHTDQISVFIEVWNEPLMTAGPGSYMDELIVLAGGENIAGDSPTPWPMFSEELVIERDPQVIILTNFNLAEALGRKSWQEVAAYKSGAVYEVNPDLYARTTPRILDALEELITFLDAVEQ